MLRLQMLWCFLISDEFGETVELDINEEEEIRTPASYHMVGSFIDK